MGVTGLANAARSLGVVTLALALSIAGADTVFARGDRAFTRAPSNPDGVRDPPGSGVTVPHVELLESSPADGDTLIEGPDEIRLRYSEPVEAALARVLLVREGAQPLALDVRTDPTDVYTLLATRPASPTKLPPGGYRLAWRVVSADGHPVEGSFVFHLLATPDDATAAMPPPPDPVSFAGDAGDPDRSEAAGSSVAAGLLRGLAAALMLALAGLLFVHLPTRASRSLAGLTVLASLATALMAVHFVVWSIGTTLLPVGEATTAVLTSATGRLEATRLVALALALWALGLTRRPGLAFVFAAIAVVASAGIGHSLAVAPLVSVPLKAVHLLLAAAWFGGVLHLAFGALATDRFRVDTLRVSALALAAVVGITVTGILQAALLMGSIGELFATDYGRLVLAKTAGLLLLIAVGAHNRYRLIPALADHADASRAPAAADPAAARRVAAASDSAARLRRATRFEMLVMLATIVVAGVLAYTPHGGM